MKNVFVIFLMGFSLTIMAQHVTPLDIKIAELNLDSLRGAYLAQPTMYRASLDVVAEQLEKNAQQIKEAQNELKTEMSHAKEMKRVLNEIWNKPAWHGDLDAVNRSKAGRNMNEIGG